MAKSKPCGVRLCGQALLLVSFAAALAGGPAFAGPPDFSGRWLLNAKMSDDVQAKIEAVAGSADVKGVGPDGARDHWLPPREGGEVDRVRLRKSMLLAADQIGELDIAQSSTEVKIAQGDLDRIFYFGRESTREMNDGEMVKARASWKDDQLVIIQEGEKGLKITELITLLSGGNQVAFALRYEAHALKAPLDVRLVYDRKATR